MIKNYEQQQTKAARVLKRLQNDYESRIAVKLKRNIGLFFSVSLFDFFSIWLNNNDNKRQIMKLIDMR